MSSTLKQRMAELQALKPGISKSDLARAAGVKAPSVSDWFSGKTKEIKSAPALAVAALYGVNVLWLTQGKGPRDAHERADGESILAIHPDDELPPETVSIPEHQIKFSGGNGTSVIDYELSEDAEPATYRLSWLQRNKLSAARLRRFKVSGQSMEPLLFHGDTVLVNLAENSLEHLIDGKVYAIRYGDELRVKRLFRRLDGTLILRSDNEAFKDEEVPPMLVEKHITIIGRVRDKSGSGGL